MRLPDTRSLNDRLAEIRRLQGLLGGPDEPPGAAEKIVSLCHDLRNELTLLQLMRDLAKLPDFDPEPASCNGINRSPALS
jgi:hypothetical protein